LTIYLDSPLSTMYIHSNQYIQDLLSLHSVFHGLTTTDGQLSQLDLTISGRPGCTRYIQNSCDK